MPWTQQATGSGEGLEYSLEPMWTLAPVAWLLGWIALVALVLLLYLRERGSAGLSLRMLLATIRLLLIGMVLLMLAGWLLRRNRTDLPDVVLLIDDSRSMLFEDHFQDKRLTRAIRRRLDSVRIERGSRINMAKTLLLEDDQALLDFLSSKYNLKVYRIGSSLRPETIPGTDRSEFLRDLAADQSRSLLGKCLQDALELQRGRPTAAVIMLTDGITTEGRSIADVAAYARRKAIPLYLVGLGSDQTPRDLRLSDLLVDEVVFVNDVVSFEARLTGSGLESETVVLRLRAEPGGEVLAERTVEVGEDGEPQSVRISYRPQQPGEFNYVLEVDQLAGESNPDNNRVSQMVSVRDEMIRVLLVQSYPSFEYRYLSTLLRRQLRGQVGEAGRSVELTTVLQEADPAFAEADEHVRRVFPVGREELFEYDVILFGDVNPAGLGKVELRNLADFVKVRGGGIVFIAGPRFLPLHYRDTPLSDLMPIDLRTAELPPEGQPLTEPFPVRPTSLGLASPPLQLSDSAADNARIWHQLDGLYWLLEAPDLKPAARVWAEHPTRTGTDGRNLPVICMQFVGAGKVVFHATDETHRWQARNGQTYFARYWMQTLRYLSRSKLLGKSRAVELTSDFQQYRRGEVVNLRVRFLNERAAPPQDDGVTVVLEKQSGSRRHLKLHRHTADRGIFEGTISNLLDGDYRVWLANPTLDDQPPSLQLSVVAPPGEEARLEMDAANLRQAAQVSRGQFYSLPTSRELMRDLPEGRQVRIASLPPISIWSMWQVAMAFATLFVMLIVTEWILRKWAGML